MPGEGTRKGGTQEVFRAPIGFRHWRLLAFFFELYCEGGAKILQQHCPRLTYGLNTDGFCFNQKLTVCLHGLDASRRGRIGNAVKILPYIDDIGRWIARNACTTTGASMATRRLSSA